MQLDKDNLTPSLVCEYMDETGNKFTMQQTNNARDLPCVLKGFKQFLLGCGFSHDQLKSYFKDADQKTESEILEEAMENDQSTILPVEEI